ncbi:hypothetical protein, partial [Halpernia sp. GG3]
VSLIDDIIRLSQLDEGGSLPMEEVSLKPLAEEVFSVLQDASELKNITMTVSGEAALYGVRRLLFEMLYNLCDNAVKYNRPGGRVDVKLWQETNPT